MDSQRGAARSAARKGRKGGVVQLRMNAEYPLIAAGFAAVATSRGKLPPNFVHGSLLVMPGGTAPRRWRIWSSQELRSNFLQTLQTRGLKDQRLVRVMEAFLGDNYATLGVGSVLRRQTDEYPLIAAGLAAAAMARGELPKRHVHGALLVMPGGTAPRNTRTWSAHALRKDFLHNLQTRGLKDQRLVRVMEAFLGDNYATLGVGSVLRRQTDEYPLIAAGLAAAAMARGELPRNNVHGSLLVMPGGAAPRDKRMWSEYGLRSNFLKTLQASGKDQRIVRVAEALLGDNYETLGVGSKLRRQTDEYPLIAAAFAAAATSRGKLPMEKVRGSLLVMPGGTAPRDKRIWSSHALRHDFLMPVQTRGLKDQHLVRIMEAMLGDNYATLGKRV
jgi:hypothetical protein